MEKQRQGWRGVGPVGVGRAQHLTLVVIVIISQFVSQIWLERYGKSAKEWRRVSGNKKGRGGRFEMAASALGAPERRRTDKAPSLFLHEAF